MSDRAEQWDLYKIALDEYRFQVNLNWSRTQYYIVLNLGILGVATGLLRLDDPRVASAIGLGLYVAGVACAVLSLAAVSVQRGYYRQAKHHKRRLEEALDLGESSIRTTPGMDSPVRRRLGKVDTFNRVMLSIILVLDLLGLVYTCVALF